jgi:hypothetical protein
VVSAGLASGNSPKAGLAADIDYVRLGHTLGWRAGAGGVFPIIGARSLYGFHLAGLWVLDTDHDRQDTLLTAELTRTSRTLGVELAVGRIVDDGRDGREAGLFGGSLLLGYQVLSFTTVESRTQD